MRRHIAVKEILGDKAQAVYRKPAPRLFLDLAHNGLLGSLSKLDPPADGIEIVDSRIADHQELAVLQDDRADADVDDPAAAVDTKILSHDSRPFLCCRVRISQQELKCKKNADPVGIGIFL